MARKWPGFILPIFILVFLWGNMVRKPKATEFAAMRDDGQLHVIQTSLSDTLGAALISDMGVKDVPGIKLQRGFHSYSAYFEYNGTPEQILRVLSSLPVPVQSGNMDVTCGELSFPDFVSMARGMRPEELEHTSTFWTASFPPERVYDCLKPPFRHTIIVNSDRSIIRHRVEYSG